MAREIETQFASDEECDNCGTRKSEFEVTDHGSEGSGGKGAKHMEVYECPSCGARGTQEFTPPTGVYTLKGPLFGEPEDPDELQQEVNNL